MSKKTKDRLHYLLYSSLENELTEEAKKKLTAELLKYPDIYTKKEHLWKIQHLLKLNPLQLFRPGFSDRVLNQVRNIKFSEDNIFDSIIFVSRRFTLAGVMSILILAFNNILMGNEFSVESLLALPQVSLENTISLDPVLLETE